MEIIFSNQDTQSLIVQGLLRPQSNNQRWCFATPNGDQAENPLSYLNWQHSQREWGLRFGPSVVMCALLEIVADVDVELVYIAILDLAEEYAAICC